MSKPSVNLARLSFTSMKLATLCEELGSLSAAASRAHMSVSGASHRLNAFESTIGCQIFERHQRGLKPTVQGEQIVGYCKQIIEMTERLVGSTRSKDIGNESIEGIPK